MPPPNNQLKNCCLPVRSLGFGLWGRLGVRQATVGAGCTSVCVRARRERRVAQSRVDPNGMAPLQRALLLLHSVRTPNSCARRKGGREVATSTYYVHGSWTWTDLSAINVGAPMIFITNIDIIHKHDLIMEATFSLKTNNNGSTIFLEHNKQLH